LYGEGAHHLQDQFDSRRLADRLEQVTVHDHLAPNDIAFVERSTQLLLATVDPDGWPDVCRARASPPSATSSCSWQDCVAACWRRPFGGLVGADVQEERGTCGGDRSGHRT